MIQPAAPDFLHDDRFTGAFVEQFSEQWAKRQAASTQTAFTEDDMQRLLDYGTALSLALTGDEFEQFCAKVPIEQHQPIGSAPVAPGSTPRTDALIARHTAETEKLDKSDDWFIHGKGRFPDRHVWAAHSRRQAQELIDHTRQLERELAEARFSPLGDNHHNALACPYCNPNGRLVDSTTPRRAQGREMKLAQVIEEMKSWAEDEYATPAGRRIAKWVVAIEASPSSPIPEGLEPGIALPEWRYDPKHSMLYSSNFTHDAALHLTGDFADDAQRTAYASQIVAALNALNASGGGDAAAMRERCARVCNALADKWSSPYGTTTWPYAFRDAAAAIRAMPLSEHNDGKGE